MPNILTNNRKMKMYAELIRKRSMRNKDKKPYDNTLKSAMANLIETDLFDQNPGKDIIVLSFTLEMSSSRQIGRKFSNKLMKTTSELYSANEDLDDESFNKILGISKSLSKYNIYYVDDPGTPEEVSRFIFNFYNEYVKDKHQYFVIIYDHALLTGKSGTTLDTISDLQKEFIKVKKLPLTTVIELSQLNRNIEASERINNPQNQFLGRAFRRESNLNIGC